MLFANFFVIILDIEVIQVCITFFIRGGKKFMDPKELCKYEYAKKMLETELQILISEFERKHGYMPVEHVKSRIKSDESIRKKLESRGYEYTTDNIIKHISDVVGIRIVVSFLSDVYDIVSMITKSTNILIKKRKDYIKEPKDSGYSSYHLIVLVAVYLEGYVEYVTAEIQVRTVAMDFWASLDHKIRYKFHEEIPLDVQQAMEEYALDIQELDRKMYELNKVMSKYERE